MDIAFYSLKLLILDDYYIIEYYNGNKIINNIWNIILFLFEAYINSIQQP